MAERLVGPGYSLADKANMYALIRRHTDKSQLEAVLATPGAHLNMEIQCHQTCLPGMKMYLKVIGMQPNLIIGVIVDQTDHIHAKYTFEISDF